MNNNYYIPNINIYLNIYINLISIIKIVNIVLFQTSYIFNINIYNNINTIYFIIIKKYRQKLLSSKIIITS